MPGKLPIGIHDFSMLREDHFLYVDKTAQLEKLIAMGQRYFLSRQHGFGKSLLLSTLAAMFSGKADLFQGLAAEALVRDLAQNPMLSSLSI